MGVTYTTQQIHDFLVNAGFSGNEILPMAAIAWRESRFVSDARNPSDRSKRQADGRVAAGVWQIMTKLPEDQIVSQGFYDGQTSANKARSLFESSIRNGYSGYRPWGFTSDQAALAYGASHNNFPAPTGAGTDTFHLGPIDTGIPTPGAAVSGFTNGIVDGLKSFGFPILVGLLGALCLYLGVEILIGESRTFKSVVAQGKDIAGSVPVPV